MSNTFVIVTWNSEHEIVSLLDSIILFEPEALVRIIDNNSSDSTRDLVKRYSVVHEGITLIPSEKNLGFARANNIAVQGVVTKYVTFINPDAKLSSPVTEALTKNLKDQVGIATGKIVNSDGNLQPSIYNFQTPLSIFIEQFRLGKILSPRLKDKFSPELSKHDTSRKVDWVIGAFMFMDTNFYRSIGGFSEDYFLYSEDMDLCYKVYLAGKLVWFDPKIQVMHMGGVSEAQDVSSNKSTKLINSFLTFADKYGFARNRDMLLSCYSVKMCLSWPIALISQRFRASNQRYKAIVRQLKNWKGVAE